MLKRKRDHEKRLASIIRPNAPISIMEFPAAPPKYDLSRAIQGPSMPETQIPTQTAEQHYHVPVPMGLDKYR